MSKDQNVNEPKPGPSDLATAQETRCVIIPAGPGWFVVESYRHELHHCPIIAWNVHYDTSDYSYVVPVMLAPLDLDDKASTYLVKAPDGKCRTIEGSDFCVGHEVFDNEADALASLAKAKQTKAELERSGLPERNALRLLWANNPDLADNPVSVAMIEHAIYAEQMNDLQRLGLFDLEQFRRENGRVPAFVEIGNIHRQARADGVEDIQPFEDFLIGALEKVRGSLRERPSPEDGAAIHQSGRANAMVGLRASNDGNRPDIQPAAVSHPTKRRLQSSAVSRRKRA